MLLHATTENPVPHSQLLISLPPYNKLMPKMRRKTLTHLLLTWLLLVAFCHHCFSAIEVQVQGPESVDFNLRTAKPSSRSPTGNVIDTWAERKKIRKAPSGPNPVGNHRPPSRP